MFPKRSFITFINEKYIPLADKLVESISLFSNYTIIVYSYNFDYIPKKSCVFTKRINDAELKTPNFETIPDVVQDNLGIVNRADYNTYYTLSRKPAIMLDAINNGLEEGVFLDADGLAANNIDDLFDWLPECIDYPLIGKGLFEYMMLYGKGDPSKGATLEQPMMNLLGIWDRTLHYGQTNVILFNKNCRMFFEECETVSKNKNILKNNLLYAPYHDETIMNVLLWKRKATKQLPLVHFNLSNFEELQKFIHSPSDIYLNNSPWHKIPKNKNDIKFFHGCKSISELDKCLNFFKNRSSINPIVIKNEKQPGQKKIAIVTLFDKNYEKLAEMSIPNKVDYAAKHGYDVIYFDKAIDPSRPPQWSKVKAIEYTLNDYDWVWWIDIDSLIMEFDIKLESIIDENYDIIFTSNKYSYLSNGSSFFKNSEITKKFLKDCYDLEIPYLKNINVQVFDHEQQSMRALILNDSVYKQKTKLIDERVCNSYCTTTNNSVLSAYPNWNNEPNLYNQGDFVIQFCGRTFDERLVIFEEYSKKINNSKRNVAIIGSFANNEKKVNSLKKCIEQCKKMSLDTILVSNFEDSDEIKNLVTYYIYDPDNTLLPKHRSPIKWFADNKDTIHIHHTGNSYICCKNMHTGIHFCKNKYDNFLYLDYDNIILEEDFPKVTKLFDTLNSHGAWICNFHSNGNEYYETTIYAGNVDFFTTKVNLAKSIDEWNTIPPYSYTDETLERIFPVLLNENKDSVYFTNMSAKQYFEKSNIDTFSVFSFANIAYNAEDESLPYAFVITLAGTYTIIVDDNITYQHQHSANEWIKCPIKITDKDTNVKIKCNDQILIDKNLNLANIKEFKQHCVRYPIIQENNKKVNPPLDDVPIVILCRNNEYYVKNTLNQLEKYHNNFIILDNCSDDEDTKKYLQEISKKYKVINTDSHLEPYKARESIYDQLPQYFCFTDPDLEYNENLSNNFIKKLIDISNKHGAYKVGAALKISDHNQMYQNVYSFGKTIYEWESQFWKNKIEDSEYELYEADIDTTFALYNKNFPKGNKVIRAAGEFMCKHLPWYPANNDKIDDKTFNRMYKNSKWSTISHSILEHRTKKFTNNMNISLLCPTRKRPENIKRLINSAIDTAKYPEKIEFIFYIDRDDEDSKKFFSSDIKNCTVIMGGRIVLSQMWNRCYQLAASDVCMHCGDDIVFRTKNWDELVIDTFSKYDDKIAFIHGDDGIQGDRIGTHGFLHKNWVNTLGYFVPPYFSCDYNDTWLTEVSNKINRKIYLPELITEHMHYVVGKSEYDITHQERIHRAEKDDIHSLYNSLQYKREEDANKLLNFIQNHKK